MIVNNTLVIVQKPGGNNHKTLLINPLLYMKYLGLRLTCLKSLAIHQHH